MSKATKKTLMTEFLGEMVTIFMTDLNTVISSDEGTADVPLVCEGILVDYDDRFMLVSNEMKTQFTLLALDRIAKIDLTDRMESSGPSKMDPSGMN